MLLFRPLRKGRLSVSIDSYAGPTGHVFNPFNKELNGDLGLARAARACYLPCADRPEPPLPGRDDTGAVEVETFGAGPDAGYVFHGEREDVLAFRGTVDPAGWANNFRVRMTEAVRGEDKSHDSGNGKLHRGFAASMENLWDEFAPLLDKKRRLKVCGHSRGGGLALPAAKWLDEDGYKIDRVAVFGCPRVADGTWCDAYDRALGWCTVQYANESDPVPWAPLWTWGYRRSDNLLWFDGSAWHEGVSVWGWVKTFALARTWPWWKPGDPVRDHAIGRYVEALRVRTPGVTALTTAMV